MSYWRFGAMIVTSTLVMYALMYLHTYAWDHVYVSETRMWMALLMGSVMAIVMLGFMRDMYPSRRANTVIGVSALSLCVLAAWLVRSQATVTSLDYMQAMVPHHSIALLTSERARIDDPRVRKLADEIIDSQRKEIAEMAYLIGALQGGATASAHPARATLEELPPGEAARRADIAKTDLEPLRDDEVRSVLGDGPVCRFSFARDGTAVAAATATGASVERGVIKLHGHVARMGARYGTADQEGFALAGDDVRVVISLREPRGAAARVRAAARLTIGSELEAGYAGFYRCER